MEAKRTATEIKVGPNRFPPPPTRVAPPETINNSIVGRILYLPSVPAKKEGEEVDPADAVAKPPKTRGIPGVFVIALTGDKQLWDIGPPPVEHSQPVIKLRNGKFEPKAIVVAEGKTLRIENLDKDKLLTLEVDRGESQFLSVRAGEHITIPKLPLSFRPHRLRISHPTQEADVMVARYPFLVTVTDAEGRFTIPQVPVGRWEFTFWYRHSTVRTVTKKNEETEFKRGVCRLDVKQGNNDVGEFVLSENDIYRWWSPKEAQPEP